MARKGILLTGGSGLVGAYAAAMLQERGERPVIFDVALNERLLEPLHAPANSAIAFLHALR